MLASDWLLEKRFYFSQPSGAKTQNYLSTELKKFSCTNHIWDIWITPYLEVLASLESFQTPL